MEQIDYFERDDWHSFKINDNGIGIAQEYHEQIFNMFKKLKVNNYENGSGMGLSIAKKTIEKLGGKIEIASSILNEGSTFIFYFPKSSLAEKLKISENNYKSNPTF